MNPPEGFCGINVFLIDDYAKDRGVRAFYQDALRSLIKFLWNC